MSEQGRTDWSTKPVRRPRFWHSFGSWLPGLALIVVGLVFLAQNYLGYSLRNWWAFFILIPAFGSFSDGAEALRRQDNDEALGEIVTGLGFTVLAAAFLFELDIGRLWPIALIILGIGLLITRGRSSWAFWD
jgi:hypothetical protein